MNLRQYLATMLFATILCWIAWGFVVLNVDPFQTVSLGFIFFYVSLGLALLGTISLVVFGGYYFFSKQDVPLFRFVQLSFRQSVLVSLFAIMALYLQGKDWLSFWNGAVLISFFLLCMSLSFSLKKTRGV